MIKFIFFFLSAVTIFSCTSNKQIKSTHPYADYFYPYDTIPKIYLYRDVANGLDEEFHRVYSLGDKAGKHIIVERYSSDGRILEALNYNLDSLDLQDHMVVNFKQEKTKAILYKNKLFPLNKNNQTWFATKFQGMNDSTLFLREVKRNLVNTSVLREIMEKKVTCLEFHDSLRQSLINPFTNKENVIEANMITLFGEGLGIVEWYSPNKKSHFRLEQILTQEEWLKIISH
jgi:hypothetical protein